jgi:putative nucleotidyltransferase with HDIG domain
MTTRHVSVDSRVIAILTTLTAATTLGIVASLDGIVEVVRTRPGVAAAFLGFTMLLQFFAVEVHGKGRVGVGAIAKLATGFVLGVGPAMVVALAPAVVNYVKTSQRAPLYRYVFDATLWSTCAGLAVVVYETAADGPISTFFAALAAGVVYVVLNNGLLCSAIGFSEGRRPIEIWRERFSWAQLHYLTFGLLAYAAARGYEALGLIGLIAFGLPPALLILSFRQYSLQTKKALDAAEAANTALQTSNALLESRNDDLRELFQFASGLARHAANRESLVAYAEGSLSRLTGVRVRLSGEADAAGVALSTASGRVGTLVGAGEAVDDRWLRLRDAIVPQLATALEGAELVERVRKTHLATIAALSRSMEAKDGYTGGHTERVADLAVGLARRVGVWGSDLEAIEVGALLHDIGKIGIPEPILHKPGPLNDEEWELMKQHPLISEYILEGIGLDPIVLQIARSSHERIDGKGYPDGLAGDEIPLGARIVLVADAIDAMTSDRPYRRARPPRAALAELRAEACTQFCPVVVEAAERLYTEQPELFGEGDLRLVSVA